MFNSFILAAKAQIPQKEKALDNQTPLEFENLQNIENITPIYTHSYIRDDKKSPFSPKIKYDAKTQLGNDPPLKLSTSADVINYKKIPLSMAIEYALENNRDIKNIRLNINVAKNDIKSANRLKNPYIQSFFNTGTAATDNPNSVGLIVPVEIAKRSARKNLAKSSLELTKGSVALAELSLRLNVRQAYVNLVAAKSTLKILNDQRLLLQDLVNISQKKYKAGAAPGMDVIHSKMTLNQLLLLENSARTNVLVERHKFNFLLASIDFDSIEDYLPEEKDFIFMLTPNPSGIMPDFEHVAELAMSKRIDIKNAKQEIDVAKKNLINIARKRIPDIDIGGGYLFVPSELSTRDQVTMGVFAALNITEIPLLYLHNPEIKNAKILLNQKQINYENVKHKALMDLHASYDAFITAQANLNYYNDILLTESKQFLQMARQSYLIGKASITDYIFIEQSYRNIMISYTKALCDYYSSWINVLRDVQDEEFKLYE